MRELKTILRDYLKFLNKEKALGYTDEEIEIQINDVKEKEVIKKLLIDDLYEVEEYLKQTISTERAFKIWCSIVLCQDFKTHGYIWNDFVKKQFNLVEKNRYTCYMAARAHGKTFFLGLYADFKMFLIPYYEVGYCSNIPKQRKRFLKLTENLIDTNALLIERKDVKGVHNKSLSWGNEEMEYNSGILEGTTVGTTPRGGHYNLAIGDDPLRDDRKYTHEFIVNYFQGVYKQCILRKKGRYIIVGCVSPDTKILTEKGIEEIGDQIIYNPEKKSLIPFKKRVYGKNGWDETSKFYVNGKTKTRKITLVNGYELECSEIHPLWTCISPRRNVRDVIKKDCQWIKSSKLKVGDKIALKIGTNVFGKKPTISEEEAYFYGLYTAEGSSETKGRANRITISNTDTYCINFLKDELSFISQDKVHHRKNSIALVNKMRSYGLSFTTCHYKRVPKKLMLEPKNIQVAFLQGLYDGDGHCTISKDNRARVVLTSTSKKQLLDVQTILLNFGMVSSLNKATHKAHHKLDGSYIKESKSYSLTCSGLNAQNFIKQIGFRIKRKNKDLSMIKSLNLNEKFGFIWKKIKKIENSENYTVDFVIPKNHSFLTNGIVSHNTPQDPEDVFHVLMNDKLDKNNRPIGKTLVDGLSAAGFHTNIFPCLDEKTKKVLVPEIWTYEDLMIEKNSIGELRFNRELMCKCGSHRNSLVSSSLFRKCCDENLEMIQQGEEGKKYVVFIDPATSDAPTADFVAMSVWEDDEANGKFILRNLFHDRGFPITDPEGGTDDQTHVAAAFYKDFNKALMIVEKNNAGVALIQALQAKDVPVIEHITHVQTTQRLGKAEDVTNYVEHGLKAGVIVFPCDPDDIFTTDILDLVKNEHLNFGVKQTNNGEKYEALAGKDDIFDSCWGAFKYRGDCMDTLDFALTIDGGVS